MPIRSMRRAQFVVLPSYAEGLPLVPLEAMAHGLPSIGFSDCSGIPLLIENGVTGLHVARENQVENLAEAIRKLMADPALRSSMGAAAKARYDAMFAPELDSGSLGGGDPANRIAAGPNRRTSRRSPARSRPASRSIPPSNTGPHAYFAARALKPRRSRRIPSDAAAGRTSGVR